MLTNEDLTKEDLILIRDVLQLDIISFTEFMSNCVKHGGFVPTWAKVRFEQLTEALCHVNDCIGGD